MNRNLALLLLVLMVSLDTFAQVAISGGKQKVAVYVIGGEENGTNSVLASNITDAIVKSGKYIAVERTAEFLQQLQKEQNYQRTGNVSDVEIARQGKQFGVQYVCVAELLKFDKYEFIIARLIDVETALIVSTANDYFEKSDLKTFMRTATDVTQNLLQTDIKQLANIDKVAVYFTSKEQSSISKIISAELVEAITLTSKFRAVERTGAFIEQMQKEVGYQQEGNVSDAELARLGRQFGVKYICSATLTKVYDSYYLATKLINVETAEVTASSNAAIEVANVINVFYRVQNISTELLYDANAFGNDYGIPLSLVGEPQISSFSMNDGSSSSYKGYYILEFSDNTQTIRGNILFLDTLSNSSTLRKCIVNTKINIIGRVSSVDLRELQFNSPIFKELQSHDNNKTIIQDGAMISVRPYRMVNISTSLTEEGNETLSMKNYSGPNGSMSTIHITLNYNIPPTAGDASEVCDKILKANGRVILLIDRKQKYYLDF
jgi:hypothetical protein